MEWKLVDGDYVPDGMGGFTALGGGEEVLARVLYRLTARRGAMPFLPGLGSRLYQLGREKPSSRQALAAQYVAEALQEEPDLEVESVELRDGREEALLTVWLNWKGEKLTVQMPVSRTAGYAERRRYENR